MPNHMRRPTTIPTAVPKQLIANIAPLLMKAILSREREGERAVVVEYDAGSTPPSCAAAGLPLRQRLPLAPVPQAFAEYVSRAAGVEPAFQGATLRSTT